MVSIRRWERGRRRLLELALITAWAANNLIQRPLNKLYISLSVRVSFALFVGFISSAEPKCGRLPPSLGILLSEKSRFVLGRRGWTICPVTAADLLKEPPVRQTSGCQILHEVADNDFICLAEPRRNVSHESTRNEDPRSHRDKLPGGGDE